ncbi:MAG TPA: hypothetical protein VNJ28_04630 [Candidatus Limnocylindrales bacterium]|nr:hypothetical protein [Candidatus Limnocylindrales bacterium]
MIDTALAAARALVALGLTILVITVVGLGVTMLAPGLTWLIVAVAIGMFVVALVDLARHPEEPPR